MSFRALTMAEVVAFVAVGVLLAAAIAAWVAYRKHRTNRLQTAFGDAEYARTVKADGSRRHAEAQLDLRTARVEAMQVRPLGLADRARFLESWRGVQARFIDGPAAAVTEADLLLSDVMSTRGYPTGNFEQRAGDVSVDHPRLLQDYRAAHEIAVRQVQGEASTEELRRAMIHYRILFEELVSEPGRSPSAVAP